MPKANRPPLGIVIQAGLLLAAFATLFFLYRQTKGLSEQTRLLAEQTAAQSNEILEQRASREMQDRMSVIDRFATKFSVADFRVTVETKESGKTKMVLRGNLKNFGENSVLVLVDPVFYTIVRCRDNEIISENGRSVEKGGAADQLDSVFVENENGDLEIEDRLPRRFYYVPPGGLKELSIYTDLPFQERYEAMLDDETIAIQLTTLAYDPDQYYFKEYIQAASIQHGVRWSFKGKNVVFPAIKSGILAVNVFAKSGGGWIAKEGQSDCIYAARNPAS